MKHYALCLALFVLSTYNLRAQSPATVESVSVGKPDAPTAVHLTLQSANFHADTLLYPNGVEQASPIRFTTASAKPAFRANKRIAGIIGSVCLGLIFSSPFLKNQDAELSRGLFISGVSLAPVSVYFGSKKRKR